MMEIGYYSGHITIEKLAGRIASKQESKGIANVTFPSYHQDSTSRM